MSKLERTHNLLNEINSLATPKDKQVNKDTESKTPEDLIEKTPQKKNETPKQRKSYKTTFSTMSKEKLKATKNKDDSYMWDNFTSTPTFESKQQQITNFMSRKTVFKRKTNIRSPQEQNQEEKRLKKT